MTIMVLTRGSSAPHDRTALIDEFLVLPKRWGPRKSALNDKNGMLA